jgi:plasmid stabilization system protein ParE
MIVHFTAAASQEMFTITRHYAEVNRELAVRLLDQMGELKASLSENPRMGTPVTKTFRRVILRRFPYAVYYRIDELSDSLWIESVVHQRRGTENRKNRVEEEPAVYQLAA